MPTPNRYLTPKIVWGAGYASTLSLGTALDGAKAYSKPREGSETAQTVSGVEDAWVTGYDQYLEGDVRWIPITAGVTAQGTSMSGWDGTAGFRAFLEWAWAKNKARFYPDATAGAYLECYLVAPTEAPDLEDDFTRKLRLVLRTADGSPFTGY